MVSILVGCTKNVSTQNTDQTNQKDTWPVVCNDDSNCLLTNFKKCSVASFKTPFPGGANYEISILWLTGWKCNYKAMVVDWSWNNLRGSDCNVELQYLDEDLLGHLFGQDKSAWKEAILERNNKIEQENCI